MKAIDVAKYYLSKDINRELFNNNIIVKNDIKSYEGNVRLNKYLFLTQVVYIAKYGKELFDDDFVAYINGPVIKDIVINFQHIPRLKDEVNILPETKVFLDKIYDSLKNASCEELIDITHEDPEWIRLSSNTYNAPKMNLVKNAEIYKKRYKGLIEALDL